MSEMQLPDSWIRAKLGTITEIVGGGTPSRDNPSYFQGDIPWVSPTDISKLDDIWIDHTAESISEKGLQNSSAVLLPVGSVLMTCRASFGLLAINLKEICTSQSLYSFICNKDLIFNEYLVYCLTSMRKRLAQLAGETTFKGISKSTLSRVEIPLPPLPEQRRIAAILREAEEIRRLRKEANEKMQKIVEALFYDMFGDPIKPKIGWTSKRLSDFVDINSNLVLPTKEKYKDLWHIGSDNIEGETGRIFGLQTIAEVGAISNNFLFSKNNILYSKIRPSLRKVATPDFAGLCSADIYPLTYDTKQVSKYFLTQLLRSNGFTDYAVRVSGRAQIPKINREDLLKYETILPDLESQKAFEERVLRLLSARNLEEKFSGISSILSQSLLSRAFTGDLTTSWREEHAEELAQAARDRDALLQKQSMIVPETRAPVRQIEPAVDERREDLVYQLSPLQKALLAIFRSNTQFYFTSYQFYEEYEEELQKQKRNVSLDLVRRELHTLAALGLVREVALPVTDQPGRIDYITVYRYPQPEDESAGEDLEYLTVRSL